MVYLKERNMVFYLFTSSVKRQAFYCNTNFYGYVGYFFGQIQDIRFPGRIFAANEKFFVTTFLITIQLRSVRISICPSVRPSICNMYELLLIYCYSTKNLKKCYCLFEVLLLNIEDLIAR